MGNHVLSIVVRMMGVEQGSRDGEMSQLSRRKCDIRKLSAQSVIPDRPIGRWGR
jgi:hypothetical protein